MYEPDQLCAVCSHLNEHGISLSHEPHVWPPAPACIKIKTAHSRDLFCLLPQDFSSNAHKIGYIADKIQIEEY